MKLHMETIEGKLPEAVKAINEDGLAEFVVHISEPYKQTPYTGHSVDVVFRLPDNHHLITGAFTI